MTTWNDDVTHYIRNQGGPIDTRLKIKLEGDFTFVQLPEEEPNNEDEQPKCDLILGDGVCTAHVWLPGTIGSGDMTPTAALFDNNDQYISNFNCAMPAVEDGQPQSRKARNQGNRWLDSYPLNVQALHDQRGDAAYFTLTFLSVPYFYKEDVPIYFSGAIRDDLPMVFFRQGVEYLVTKIRFPEDENAEQPDAEEQERTNAYRSVAEISMARTMKTKPVLKQRRG